MNRILAAGWRVVQRRRSVVLLGFVLNFLASFSFGALAWSWLSSTLGDSLPTRTLVTEVSPQVFIDLMIHHGAELRLLLGQGALVLSAGIVLTVWFQACAALAVTTQARLRECMQFGRLRLRRFGTLWCLNAVMCAGVALVIWYSARLGAASEAVTSNESRQTALWMSAAGVGLGLYLFFSVVHEQARIHCAATDASALDGFRWASRFVFRQPARAFGLGALSLLANLAMYLVYRSFAALIAVDSGFGVTVSLLLGQLLIAGRIWLRVWSAGCVATLQFAEEGVGEPDSATSILPVD